MPWTLVLLKSGDRAAPIRATLRKQDERHRLAGIQRIIRAADPYQLLSQCNDTVLCAGFLLEEGQIEFAAGVAFHQIFRLVGFDFQSYHRMLVLESCQPSGEVASKEIKRHAEANETRKYIVGHRGIGLVVKLQNAPRVSHEL